MPKVTLTGQFDWRVPGKRAMMSWPPGEHMLTTPQAAAARAAGLVAPAKAPADAPRL